jgi:hypothetical protein
VSLADNAQRSALSYGALGAHSMNIPGLKAVAVAALYCANAVGGIAAGQVDVDEILNPEAALPAVDDEIIVRGRRGADLRLEVERAENAIFARFNDINSDDRFDITCRLEAPIGSRIDRRVCESNDWREQAANFGAAWVRQSRGEGILEQQRGQRELTDEMRRLVYQDEELYQAVERMGRARMELAEFNRSAFRGSYARAVIPNEEGLPLGAARMFHVWVGSDRWTHPLGLPTFGMAQISGKIRNIEIECDEGRERHKYEDKQAWTLPPDWSACVLLVSAQRKTEFALYEFEQ